MRLTLTNSKGLASTSWLLVMMARQCATMDPMTRAFGCLRTLMMPATPATQVWTRLAVVAYDLASSQGGDDVAGVLRAIVLRCFLLARGRSHLLLFTIKDSLAAWLVLQRR